MERIAQDGLPENFLEVTAALKALVKRANGEVEDLGVVCRKSITNAFKTVLVKALAGDAASIALISEYYYHEWGTSSQAEAAADTKCVAPQETVHTAVTGYLDGGSQAASYTPPTFTYTTVCAMVSGGSLTITEHCVHPTDAYNPADANGLDRNIFTGIPLTTGDSITFTYVLSFTG